MTPAELTHRERIAQGLAPTVADRDALRRLAGIFTKKADRSTKADGLEVDRADRSTPTRAA